MKKLLIGLLMSYNVSAAQLEVVFPTPTIRHDVTSSQMAQESGVKLLFGQEMQGLFYNKITGSYDGKTLKVVINDPVIYVNKKHHPDSCEYKETLKHEQEHVENLKKSLETLKDDVNNMPAVDAYNKFLSELSKKDSETDSEEVYRNFFKNC